MTPDHKNCDSSGAAKIPAKKEMNENDKNPNERKEKNKEGFKKGKDCVKDQDG